MVQPSKKCAKSLLVSIQCASNLSDVKLPPEVLKVVLSQIGDKVMECFGPIGFPQLACKMMLQMEEASEVMKELEKAHARKNAKWTELEKPIEEADKSRLEEELKALLKEE